MPKVVFEPPDRMNLLGYILRSLIQRNLDTEAGSKVFRKMKGKVLVGASRMQVTLDFDSENLRVSVGQQGRPQARVHGDMSTLLGVALGKGMFAPVLAGHLKVGGRAWRLIRMLKLLKAEAKP